MTAASLKAQSLKTLSAMAKRSGVSSWNTLRKDQLVKAILRNSALRNSAKSKPASPPLVKRTNETSKTKRSGNPIAKMNGTTRRVDPKVLEKKKRILNKLKQVKSKLQIANDKETVVSNSVARKTVSENGTNTKNAKVYVPATPNMTQPKTVSTTKERLVVLVRGPYWLHAIWELSPISAKRAQAALGTDWHGSKPVLRVLTLSEAGTVTSSEQVLRNIPIHGGVKNWFIDVQNPPHSYRVEIGYLALNGRFYAMARSNVVTTPPPHVGDSLDTHWGDIVDDCEKIYALSGGYTEHGREVQELFEDRLKRPMVNYQNNSESEGMETLLPRDKRFRLNLDAEIVVRGTAMPGAHVTMQGEPLKVHSDGSFSVRMDFPNRRQVIPVVASSKDGVQHRTIVLAVERNTKAMEIQEQDLSSD